MLSKPFNNQILKDIWDFLIIVNVTFLKQNRNKN